MNPSNCIDHDTSIDVSRLNGIALDYAFARAVGIPTMFIDGKLFSLLNGFFKPFKPSEDIDGILPYMDENEITPYLDSGDAGAKAWCERTKSFLIQIDKSFPIAICKLLIELKLGSSVRLPLGMYDNER